MHEVSLNQTIIDYITGQEIEETTYEDLRQALAKVLVEDKKYPKTAIKPKHSLSFELAGQRTQVVIDLAVFAPDHSPLLALFFCPGTVGTFVRQSIAAARIHQPAPFPLVAVTDSKDVHVHETATGTLLGSGFHALPLWAILQEVVAQHPIDTLAPDRLEKEQRILVAYTGLGGPCCTGQCQTS